MIEKDIQDAIGGIVAGGAHFDAAPQGVQLPYIVIQQVGGSETEFLEGVSGQNQPRIQIDVFASKRTEANSIQSQARAILCASPFDGSPVGAPLSTYQPELKIFRRSCDYSFLAPA